jgi:signal transduction histidine kinase
MLNTLMDISEAESGTMTLELREVKVSDVMGKVMDLYGYVAEENELHTETRCPPDLFFVVDPVRIGQALGNLVDNAVKYTPRGGKVEVTAEQEGDRVLIAVKDTGIGMGPEELRGFGIASTGPTKAAPEKGSAWG